MTEFEKLRTATQALEAIAEAKNMAKAFGNSNEEALQMVVNIAKEALEKID